MAKNIYWLENGKHQHMYNEMCAAVQKKEYEWTKTAHRLFFRYYRFFNDGDCPNSMKYHQEIYAIYLEDKVDERIIKEYNRFLKKRKH